MMPPSPAPKNTPWTRENTISIAGLVLATLSIILALTQPEVRHSIGLDHPSPIQQATNPTSSVSKTAGIIPTATQLAGTTASFPIPSTWEGIHTQCGSPPTCPVRLTIQSLDRANGSFTGLWESDLGSGWKHDYVFVTGTITGNHIEWFSQGSAIGNQATGSWAGNFIGGHQIIREVGGAWTLTLQ